MCNRENVNIETSISRKLLRLTYAIVHRICSEFCEQFRNIWGRLIEKVNFDIIIKCATKNKSNNNFNDVFEQIIEKIFLDF